MSHDSTSQKRVMITYTYGDGCSCAEVYTIPPATLAAVSPERIEVQGFRPLNLGHLGSEPSASIVDDAVMAALGVVSPGAAID